MANPRTILGGLLVLIIACAALSALSTVPMHQVNDTVDGIANWEAWKSAGKFADAFKADAEADKQAWTANGKWADTFKTQVNWNGVKDIITILGFAALALGICYVLVQLIRNKQSDPDEIDMSERGGYLGSGPRYITLDQGRAEAFIARLNPGERSALLARLYVIVSLLEGSLGYQAMRGDNLAIKPYQSKTSSGIRWGG